MSAFAGSLPVAPEAYRRAIGKTHEALTTPALLLDLKTVRSNIATMAASLRNTAGLRPHAKSHKCAQIARMQVEAGAIGITTATVWEAVALLSAGLTNILIANEVVGPGKIRALAQAARWPEPSASGAAPRITVAVDDAGNAAELSAAAVAAESEISVLIDVDTGMNRCGVRSAEQALRLAAEIVRLPGLRLRGVTGYEGHAVLEKDRAVRAGKVQAAMDYLLGIVDRLVAAGFPIEVVSAGGTGSYDLTGMTPRITEIQAGSYVFTDVTRMAIVPAFAPGLTVLSTVVSRQGGTLVLDGGKKTVGVDLNLPRMVGYEAVPRSAAEEHLLFDVPADCPLAIGDRVEVIPGYAPTTINLHEVYYVLQDGVVVDVWPILARGAGQGGNP